MNKISYFFGCAIVVMVVLCFCACGGSYLSVSGTGSEVDTKINQSETCENTQDSDKIEKIRQITIYISGAVKTPGVYSLPEDSRLYEAVEKAGGFLDEADISDLNLAAFLMDGEKIHVYQKGELEDRPVSKTDSDSSGNGLININTADMTTLCSINGIGESRAQAIIDYRNEHGRYRKIEDIMQVAGIKDSLFNKIKARIRV